MSFFQKIKAWNQRRAAAARERRKTECEYCNNTIYQGDYDNKLVIRLTGETSKKIYTCNNHVKGFFDDVAASAERSGYKYDNDYIYYSDDLEEFRGFTPEECLCDMLKMIHKVKTLHIKKMDYSIQKLFVDLYNKKYLPTYRQKMNLEQAQSLEIRGRFEEAATYYEMANYIQEAGRVRRELLTLQAGAGAVVGQVSIDQRDFSDRHVEVTDSVLSRSPIDTIKPKKPS